MEFRAGGRLGCPHDYDVFRVGLVPLLEHFHRALKHVGKVPKRRHVDSEQQAELLDLRQRLRQAIDDEAYEEAARIRDLLRQKEAADEPEPR
jgi:protein arginine kinase activator